ncbi:hypothetical protein GQ53DRAFT_746381 [Thozetella sp. PMI_491]|nr:hypothetical protein GQ53DRAFT_746381 [Thozetella sp. PMI_491]
MINIGRPDPLAANPGFPFPIPFLVFPLIQRPIPPHAIYPVLSDTSLPTLCHRRLEGPLLLFTTAALKLYTPQTPPPRRPHALPSPCASVLQHPEANTTTTRRSSPCGSITPTTATITTLRVLATAATARRPGPTATAPGLACTATTAAAPWSTRGRARPATSNLPSLSSKARRSSHLLTLMRRWCAT